METYKDAIRLLMQTTKDLTEGKITIEVAKQVAINTQTLINAAKLHLEVCKYQKDIDKSFFNLLEPIDKTLKEIEENRRLRDEQPIDLSKI